MSINNSMWVYENSFLQDSIDRPKFIFFAIELELYFNCWLTYEKGRYFICNGGEPEEISLSDLKEWVERVNNVKEEV